MRTIPSRRSHVVEYAFWGAYSQRIGKEQKLPIVPSQSTIDKVSRLGSSMGWESGTLDNLHKTPANPDANHA